jgi:hypothetical protein
MDLIGILCSIIVALISFGALALIVLFLSCDLAAEQEKKQALKDKENR